MRLHIDITRASTQHATLLLTILQPPPRSTLFPYTTLFRSYPGKGNLTVTGQLGDVMQESARAALSWVRSHADELGVDEDWFAKHDVHIHVPAGAVPKDGPSAGVTMATAIASLVRNQPVAEDVGMTGEITLTGQVLPIGGIREKSFAAQLAGLKRLIIPGENKA